MRTVVLALIIATTPAQAARITDRGGRELRRVPAAVEEVKSPVQLNDLSPQLIMATLAAEDKRFFKHKGVDWLAVGRAAVTNLIAGKKVSGASTITMQLARGNKASDRTYKAKLRQTVDALKIERNQTKDGILAEYFGSLRYGNQTLGVESAARLYFAKPAKTLSLAESAFLAGLPKAPTNYDPYRSPRKARKRQHTILNRLYSWQWISRDDYFMAMKERLGIVPKERFFRAPHFTRRVYEAKGSLEQGKELTTTLDLELQKHVESTLKSHIKKLENNRATGGAVVVIDNPTGEILAWAGSPDFFDDEHAGQVDGVISPRQPGSALKPFLYGLALSQQMTTAELIPDIPTFEKDGFSPRNYDKTYHGPTRMREALACSYNVPAVRTARQVGPANLLAILRKAGFDSLKHEADHYGTGLSLGNGEVTLLELANAYAGLARGGIWLQERYFTKARKKTKPPRRFMSREEAYLITHMLSDNDARTPAFGPDSPFNVPFPMAAKTGTTKDYRDNWAIAYTRDWTIAVWVGNPDNKPMRRVTGISGAAPILRDVALNLWQKREPRPFERPNNIVDADICPLSGKTPGLWCPTRMTEVFRKGTEPKETCDMHQHDGETTIVVLPEIYRPWMRSHPHSLPEGTKQKTTHQKKTTNRPRIAFPQDGDIFKIDPSFPREAQKIRVAAAFNGHDNNIRWTVDGKLRQEKEDHIWLALKPGNHSIGFALKEGKKWVRARAVRIFVAD